MTIKKKNIFEYFWNCSKRNFGRNVRTLYLLVLIEFFLNLTSWSWRLICILLNSAGADRQWSTLSSPSSMLSLSVVAPLLLLAFVFGEFEQDKCRCRSSELEALWAGSLLSVLSADNIVNPLFGPIYSIIQFLILPLVSCQHISVCFKHWRVCCVPRYWI